MTAASPRFDLVILSHTSCKSIESLVQQLLVILDKVGDPYLEYKLSEALLFEKNSSAILDDIDQELGEAYQEKFRELDVETELRPTLNLVAMESAEKDDPEDQYICPACEHTQPKQGGIGATDTCNRCGIVGDKLQKSQRRQEVYELEKRKLEQAQNQEVNDAVERAHYDEQEELRNDAREKLGIKKKHNPYVTALAGLGIVAVVGTASYFIAGRTDAPDGKEDTQTANVDETGAATNTPNGEQKPLVTIQGGSGSIVVNNAPQTQAGAKQTATGKGGSKGTTGETTAADSTGGTAGDLGINSGTGELGELTAKAAPNTATQTMQNSVASSEQKITQAATASNGQQNGTQHNQSEVKLAALTPGTQQNSDNQTIANTGAAPAKSTTDVLTHTKPKMMANAVSAPQEIDTLKQLLRGRFEHSEHFFNRLSQKQFQEHQQRLQRLLKLGKPDLALIFTEGIEDPYLASLMVLEIARHEKKARKTELNDAMLISMKALAAKGGTSVSSSAMLSASMSQAYDLVGDKESARTLLEQSVSTLNHTDITVEQTCRLLGQIDRNHREFGNQSGADFMAETLINFASRLPETDHIYRSRIYTHLAATALRENKQRDAAEWLKHIPVQNAQEELLAQMKIIVADARKAAKKN